MHKFNRLFIIFIIAIVFSASTACSKQEQSEKKQIVIATDATWPPMEFVDENKNIIGFDIDLFKLVAKEAGFTVKFQNTAWDGIFAGLDGGKYDGIISSVTITKERQNKYDFSDPYINAGQVLIVKTGSSAVTLEDLKGKNVGAQIGTTGAFAIEKARGVILKSYDELGLAIEDLANGRLEGVVSDTPIAANYVLQNKNYRNKLKIVGEPFTQEFYGVVVKKGNTRILDMVNSGIRKLKKSGKLEELKKKWLK